MREGKRGRESMCVRVCVCVEKSVLLNLDIRACAHSGSVCEREREKERAREREKQGEKKRESERE